MACKKGHSGREDFRDLAIGEEVAKKGMLLSILSKIFRKRKNFGDYSLMSRTFGISVTQQS